MKPFTKILACSIFAILLSGSALFASSYAVLSPSLEKISSDPNSSDSLVKVLVYISNEMAGTQANKIAATSNLMAAERHRQVLNLLKSGSESMLTKLKSDIRALIPNAEIKEFWIAPALSLKISVSQIEQIRNLPGVTAVIEDAPVEYIKPVETMPTAAKVMGPSTHLTALNVPTLWSRGLKGRGRLVCSFDTGVEWSHPALQSKWRGNRVPHQAALFAPETTDTLPVDKVGHGTHTMGIMLGSTTADSFGVAPDAEWISAAVIDQGQTLTRTISDILAAFQWAVDPDGDPNTENDVPDVILNSWGVPTSILPACDQTFYGAIDNVEAAGIVTVFAAGNEGPNPMTMRIPATRATTPLNSFAVGAIDDAISTIADFSSRGPSGCDTNQIKPEVVAPGVSIYSSYRGGTYKIMSGTSMAAPFIAGLVALLRQYNPETTVEQIKTAIIQSSRDLGPAGEDNTYGFGLPDAARAIQYLPAPAKPEVFIATQVIGGDGIADPGEFFDLFLRLNLPAGNIDSLTGTISTTDTGISVISNRALFAFESGITYSMNITPYIIKFGDNMINGHTVNFALILDFPYNDLVDTLNLQLTVGRAPGGNMITHITPALKMTVTDFGQLGLGLHSIYQAGGEGFEYQNSSNLLYEGGIIVGRNALQISSAVRDSLGRADQSDFSPTKELSINYQLNDGGYGSYARFADTRSNIPIPITIDQSVTSYDNSEDDRFVIIKYFIVNNSLESLTGLYLGFLTDFDLNAGGDGTGYLQNNNLFYQIGDGRAIGILPLTANNGLLTLKNEIGKLTLTSQQKFSYISNSGVNIDDTSTADFMSVHSFGPFSIQPHDSVEVSLALLAGDDLNSLQAAAIRALSRYHGATDINDRVMTLPEDFVLYQNYPNPFNPSTSIEFELPRASRISLTIYNILGQEVANLVDGKINAGIHHVEWDGRDNHGAPVASGIYFYRLKSDFSALTKKMTLMK